jgi:hypothetical protein
VVRLSALLSCREMFGKAESLMTLLDRITVVFVSAAPFLWLTAVWASGSDRSAASGAMPGTGIPRVTFAQLDANGARVIDRSEGRKMTPLVEHFATADRDNNGVIDVPEFNAFEAAGQYIPAQPQE